MTLSTAEKITANSIEPRSAPSDLGYTQHCPAIPQTVQYWVTG